MKKIFAVILSICLLIPFMGCENKKAELQKKYDNITSEVQQTQKQIDDLQSKMDLDKAARNDADKSGATSDTEYGQTLADQDNKTYNEALSKMAELKTQLEIDQALQQTYKEQLDKMN